MKANEAPGPKGFSAGFFFQKAWPIIGKDLIDLVQSFFRSGKLIKLVNATIITLVPKNLNPSSMGDFRPISCCNVAYKCITKILANRLLPCLDSLVSLNSCLVNEPITAWDEVMLWGLKALKSNSMRATICKWFGVQ